MSKEIKGLSKDSFQAEGIELKVTQNDVIDLLVEEQVKSITDIAEAITQNQRMISDLIKEEWDVAIAKNVEKITIPKGLTINPSPRRSFNSTKNCDFKHLNHYNDNRSGALMFTLQNSHLTIESIASVTLTYETLISGITLTGPGETIKFTFKHSKKVIKFVEEHNIKVDEFMAILPAGGINEKQIAKVIKNRFTKEILKNMSLEFQKSLTKGFGVSI